MPPRGFFSGRTHNVGPHEIRDRQISAADRHELLSSEGDKVTVRPTRQNLEEIGHAPLMRIMIGVALDGATITYGEAARRLEPEADFSKIFSTEMGYAVGTLMDRLQAVDAHAPLINVLMVAQKDGKPSKGAGSFMARRFGEPSLAKDDAKTRHPKRWASAFERAAGEVYQYGQAAWEELYTRAFGEPLCAEAIEAERNASKCSSERDGINYGRGGEGPNHRALRLWITANPGSIRKRYSAARTETEAVLDSGDRIDAVYHCDDRIVVIEVKSRDSNLNDLRRGVFQCIKYRAVRAAMDVRDDPLIEPILVTEMPLPGEIVDLLKLHDIRHFQAPLDRT